MTARRGPSCYVIDVDGEPASVRLSKPPEQLTAAEVDAACEAIRYTRCLVEDMHARSHNHQEPPRHPSGGRDE